MFKFRLGTHGVNEYLAVKMMIGSVSYVGMSVLHVLWEYPVYDSISIKSTFMGELICLGVF